jgi:hypothetical protein
LRLSRVGIGIDVGASVGALGVEVAVSVGRGVKVNVKVGTCVKVSEAGIPVDVSAAIGEEEAVGLLLLGLQARGVVRKRMRK